MEEPSEQAPHSDEFDESTTEDSGVESETTKSQEEEQRMILQQEEEENILEGVSRNLTQLSTYHKEMSDLLKSARAAFANGREDFLEAVLMELEMRQVEKERVEQELTRADESARRYVQDLRTNLVDEHNKNKKNNDSVLSQNQRMEGPNANELELYDWVVDISLLSDVSEKGWKVYFSQSFDPATVMSMTSTITTPPPEEIEAAASLNPIGAPRSVIPRPQSPTQKQRKEGTGGEWEGAVVAVVGLYDKGKTFVLNNITGSTLPSGKRVSTKGLSFKHVDVDSGTHLIILDSAGSYSPVKVENELSVVEKEATELFLLELIFELSDYFICVVNDFTSLDQRYLDKLTRNLQNSTKDFREVIVVHNLKEITSREVLEHMWKTQVTHIYGSGRVHRTKVAAIDPDEDVLTEKHVEWFKTDYTRHICLANAESALGRDMNPWAFSLLRYWLKAVFVPVNRNFSVVESAMHYATIKLSNYFKSTIKLKLCQGENSWSRYIRSETPTHETLRLPQVSIDSSGIMLTRPDSFMPAVDIIKGDEYVIYMDIPGLSRKDILLSRQNVTTIIKGNRAMPYDESKGNVERRERRYGEFTMTFRIPELYERRWSVCNVEHGVLCISFKRDEVEGDNIDLKEEKVQSWGMPHTDSYL